MRSRVNMHKKIELALERLSKEHDIQAIIETNRVGRLVHKTIFKARQRKAVVFSHKFIITDRDLEK